MSTLDVVLQQIINGLALGMMYALLALGFTMVYGIIELINFSHFSVFMTGTFVGLVVLNLMGVTAGGRSLTGLPLIGTLAVLFMVTANSATSVPTRARPVRDFDTAVTPMRSSARSPTNVPVMNTLKWEKLISSMMP